MNRVVGYVVMAVLVLAGLSSCQKDTIYGNGMSVEVVHTISGAYSKVTVDGEGMVMVLDPMLPKGQVVVRCDEEILPYVSVKTFMKELTIGYKNTLTFTTPLKTEVYVSCDASVETYVVESAELRSMSVVERDSIVVVADGAVVNLPVDVAYLNGEIRRGSGALFSGSAVDCELIIENSNVEAGSLATQQSRVQMSASELVLWCERLLQADVQKRSLLRYKGDCVTETTVSEDSRVQQYGQIIL